MKRPTERQLEILRFIDSKGRCPPTLREIGEHFGIRSTNGVSSQLQSLDRKGLIALPGPENGCGRNPRHLPLTPLGIAWCKGFDEKNVSALTRPAVRCWCGAVYFGDSCPMCVNEKRAQ